MPLYEYVCRKCDHSFEELVSGADVPGCPKCSADDVARVLSRTAPTRVKDDFVPAAGPCGTCGNPNGPGSCAFD